jgi:trehalose-6-phosphate synthase
LPAAPDREAAARLFIMPTTIINISNRLPVTVGEKITKSSGGLVAALEGLSPEDYDLKWIGWPGGAIEDPARQQEVEEILTREHGCIPVFLSEEEVAGHYEGFSNSSVWPLLHYMPNYMRYDAAWWEHYRNVNQRFAERVLEMAQPGDLVWVHDYQLMLMPQMLHERMPGAEDRLLFAHAVPVVRDVPLPSESPRARRRNARREPDRLSHLRLHAALPEHRLAIARARIGDHAHPQR